MAKDSLKKQDAAKITEPAKYLGFTHFDAELVWEWIMVHLKLIGMVAGGLALLVIILVSVLNYQQTLNAKAITFEGKAIKLHTEAQEKLQTPASDTSKTDVSSPTNPYQDAIAAYQELIENYSGTESGARALFVLGSIQYELKNYDQAKQYFSQYLTKYPKGQLALNAEESLGYVFEQQQAYQQALDAFKRLENTVPATRKVEILLATARNYEALKQTELAIAAYKQIVDADTSSSLKNQAKERLELLQPTEAAPVETAKPAAAAAASPQPETTPAEVTETTPPSEVTPVATAETTPQPEVTPAETTETAPQTEVTPAETTEIAPQTEATPAETAETTPQPEVTPTEAATASPQSEATPAEATSQQ